MLVVTWEVRSLEQFKDAYRDPYYINVIEPDEHNVLDRSGPGQGVVAASAANVFIAVGHGQSTIGAEGEPERLIWKQWEEGRANGDMFDVINREMYADING
jgi:hypothetical protein